MADESKNSQDLLEQLKMSFSAEANNNEENAENNDSESLSGDDLQAELRSRFLNDSAESTDSQDDEYVIDEDFLQDALAEEERYEAAARCGASLVRVGSALFGKRHYPAEGSVAPQP